MVRAFIDTNILLRFALNDHPEQSQASRKLFEAAADGKVEL